MGRYFFRRLKLSFTIATLTVLSLSFDSNLFVSSVWAADKLSTDFSDSNAIVGLRVGRHQIEGFADVIIPLWSNQNTLLFLNPRVVLGDEGNNQQNIGLGSRYLIDELGILGANAYYDSRESDIGFRYEQFGLGVEFLGKWVDVRANYYSAQDDVELANSFNTEQIKTIIQQRKQVSTQLSHSSQDFSRVGTSQILVAKGHTIEGNTTQSTDIFRRTTSTISTTNTFITDTTRIKTNKLYEQFEGALDGWDAEVGLKLPNKLGPEIRVFGGKYHYDHPFSGKDSEGYTARLELRASKYLTFDTKMQENSLNKDGKHDYFAGVRLQIPLSGKGSFKRVFEDIKSVFKQKHRRLPERMNSDMVIRDVVIHTDISKPQENRSRRKVQVNKSKNVRSSTTQKSETTERMISSKKEVLDTVVLKDKITFIDGDSSASTEDGTAETPYKTVIGGVENAGINNTVFVCEVGGGSVCDRNGGGGEYDEIANSGAGITLQEGQVLTSSLSLSLGGEDVVFETKSKPKIVNSEFFNVNAGNESRTRGVIHATSGSTVNRFEVISRNPHTTDDYSYLNSIVVNDNTGNITITNNTLVNNSGAGFLNLNNKGSVIVTDNTVMISIENGIGLIDEYNDGSSIYERNNVTTTNAFSEAAIQIGDNAGTITVKGNIVDSGAKGIDSYETDYVEIGIENPNRTGVLIVTGNTTTGISNDSENGTFIYTDNTVMGSFTNVAATDVTFMNNTVITNADNSQAISNIAGSLILSGNTITTNGNEAHGIYNNHGTIDSSNNTITTNGNRSYGLTNLKGLYNNIKSTVIFSGNTVMTNGNDSHGIINADTLTLIDNIIMTNGDNANGIQNSGTLNNTGNTITTNGANSLLISN